MAYTKNPTWSETTPITAEKLNNLETQYEQAKADVDAHASASAPHAGHATVTALENHINSATPHAGVLATVTDLNNHINSSAPHAGHTTDAEFNNHINSLNPHPNLPSKDYIDNHINASNPHSGSASISALNAHTGASAPHSGHVKGTMRITASATEPKSPANGDIWIVI